MDAVEDVGPHRAEGLGETAGVDETDALRHRQALHRRRRGILTVTIADQKGADLVAFMPLADAVAKLDDRTRAFEPRNVRRAGRHRIAALALQAIGAIDPGGGDADQ